jgi:hypothetical protein
MPENLDHFFQCVENAGRWEFQVGIVRWSGPHRPTVEWKTFRNWVTQPDAARLARARASALKVRFFRTCERCGELHNAGHMHDPKTCQNCAERFLGIVY